MDIFGSSTESLRISDDENNRKSDMYNKSPIIETGHSPGYSNWSNILNSSKKTSNTKKNQNHAEKEKEKENEIHDSIEFPDTNFNIATDLGIEQDSNIPPRIYELASNEIFSSDEEDRNNKNAQSTNNENSTTFNWNEHEIIENENQSSVTSIPLPEDIIDSEPPEKQLRSNTKNTKRKQYEFTKKNRETVIISGLRRLDFEADYNLIGSQGFKDIYPQIQ